jgi:hypothetical protein
MIVVGIIQACMLALLAFCWHRQRAQLAWVDERDKFLIPIMTQMQIAIMVNAPTHSKSEIDGVYVGGTLVPSKVGMQQLWVVYDQLQEAWSMQRGAVNAMGRAYGVLKNWEANRPVPGPRWVCWPYIQTADLEKSGEQKFIEVLEKRG